MAMPMDMLLAVRQAGWAWHKDQGPQTCLDQRRMLFAHRLPHATDDGLRAAVRVEHQLLPSGSWQLERRLRGGTCVES